MFVSVFSLHGGAWAININSSRVCFRNCVFQTLTVVSLAAVWPMGTRGRKKPSQSTLCLCAPAPDTNGHLDPDGFHFAILG